MDKLFKLWETYTKDPEVINNPNPLLGAIFTFEGFWIWLLAKEKSQNNEDFLPVKQPVTLVMGDPIIIGKKEPRNDD